MYLCCGDCLEKKSELLTLESNLFKDLLAYLR